MRLNVKGLIDCLEGIDNCSEVALFWHDTLHAIEQKDWAAVMRCVAALSEHGECNAPLFLAVCRSVVERSDCALPTPSVLADLPSKGRLMDVRA